MYEFIKNQWVLGNYDTARVARCVAKGYITQDEADEIMVLTQAAN